MSPLSERTAAIQARLDAATPGPWFKNKTVILSMEIQQAECWGKFDVSEPNQALILNAAEDIKFLLAALVSAEARITKLTRSRADKCLKCGETRGAIMNGKLICWDGYDELGKHRFVALTEGNDHE